MKAWLVPAAALLGAIAAMAQQPHLVRQTPGSAFGYDIVEHSPREFPDVRPSFRAYRIAAPPAGYDVQLRVSGSVDSERLVRTIDPRGEGWTALALLLPLVPLLVRLWLRTVTRRTLARSRPGR